MGFIAFIQHNFWHVAPLLAVGVFGVAIVIERLNSLFKTYPLQEKKQFFDRLRAFIMADRMMDAMALCNMFPDKPVVQVVREGLVRAHQPEEMVSDGLAMAVAEANSLIQKRTPYLATIANVATLLGLFGTIAGLIASFEAVGRADPSQKSALLAAGISTAMNATMMGLAIAIPCMILFSFLMNRTNQLTAETSHAAIQTLDLLRQRFYKTGSAPKKAEAPASRGMPGAR